MQLRKAQRKRRGKAQGVRQSDGQSEPHPPRSDAPSEAVLGPDARVRDARTGETTSARTWIVARAAAEQRELEEASDELMNAVARGDVIVASDDARARGREELSDDAESGGP